MIIKNLINNEVSILMKYEQCEKCKYLQQRVNYDNGYGISYYGCSYPPYWGKVIESIFVCPIKNKSKEIF